MVQGDNNVVCNEAEMANKGGTARALAPWG